MTYPAWNGGDDYDPDGPWHALDAATAVLDRAHQLDATRIGEDIVAQLDRRPSVEDRIVSAFRRIEAGTYTPAPQPGYDPGGRADACGDLDDFGCCAAAFHDRGCHKVVEAAAATGDADAANAWREVLLNRTPDPGILGFELASPEPWDGTDWWASVLGDSGGPGPALHARMIEILGGEARGAQPEPAVPSRQPRPYVSGLRTALGLDI